MKVRFTTQHETAMQLFRADTVYDLADDVAQQYVDLGVAAAETVQRKRGRPPKNTGTTETAELNPESETR